MQAMKDWHKSHPRYLRQITAQSHRTRHLLRKMSRPVAEVLARRILARVGLDAKADTMPEALPAGQKQRVAVARALAIQPKLVLFDERTSAIDPELVGEAFGGMRCMATEGMTMLIVTHKIRFSADVADRVIFMDHRKIAAHGTPCDVLINKPTDRGRQFLSSLSNDNKKGEAAS